MGRRALIVVLDSLGVGALPDAERFGDAAADTLGHLAEAVGGLRVPHLEALGLGTLHRVAGVSRMAAPCAAWGRAVCASEGKDTITGHWELAGVLTPTPFRSYPGGFPDPLVAAWQAICGRAVLGNVAASGTTILEQLGPEHLATGRPILYTSSDSVFQVAAHEELVPVATLHAWCEAAFAVVSAPEWGVARVIARPFVGAPGAFVRTEGRRDFSLQPPQRTLVDAVSAAGLPTTSVGKVKSIFGDRGFSRALKAGHNDAIFSATLSALDTQDGGLIFSNLVDFDTLYGHRRDPVGYARALEAFDARLPELLARLGPDDVCVFTADHGCDPTAPGSDHTREHVPLLVVAPGGRPAALGTRPTFADVGATLAAWLGAAPPPAGSSFLPALGLA